MEDTILTVSDFVALLNQTLEYAYPSVLVSGELSNFRISKNRWVYFDLKDEYSSIKFFGTVYQLPGPLEDGIMVQVRGVPRLHPLYGFSVNVQFMQPVGEGSLKKAAALLEAKLVKEGLFDTARKRLLPYPPQTVGLITSAESAAYKDFIKILHERWRGIEVKLADVQVQGELSPSQIINAINYFNTHESPVDVIVVTRGGGSAEDLAAFNTESVTRAVAGSRVPTLVAIGHEVDECLAELAADQRASTPSNAAQLITPDRQDVSAKLQTTGQRLQAYMAEMIKSERQNIDQHMSDLAASWHSIVTNHQKAIELKRQVLQVLSPQAALKRGYAIVRHHGQVVRTATALQPGNDLAIQLSDATVLTKVKEIKLQ